MDTTIKLPFKNIRRDGILTMIFTTCYFTIQIQKYIFRFDYVIAPFISRYYKSKPHVTDELKH